jgi:hypothetical protein
MGNNFYIEKEVSIFFTFDVNIPAFFDLGHPGAYLRIDRRSVSGFHWKDQGLSFVQACSIPMSFLKFLKT